MTRGIGDRTTFQSLRTRGLRVRRGSLSAVYLPPDDDGPTRVAYAMTKRLGIAVVRNRLRRRLRSLVETEARAGSLPPGTLLLSAGPGAVGLDHQELGEALRALLGAVAATVSNPEGSR